MGLQPVYITTSVNIKDIDKAIYQLLEQRRRIERQIAQLELVVASPDDGASMKRSLRGRKSMPMSEREEVSRRMKAYWEKRRRRNAEKTAESATESVSTDD